MTDLQDLRINSIDQRHQLFLLIFRYKIRKLIYKNRSNSKIVCFLKNVLLLANEELTEKHKLLEMRLYLQ